MSKNYDLDDCSSVFVFVVIAQENKKRYVIRYRSVHEQQLLSVLSREVLVLLQNFYRTDSDSDHENIQSSEQEKVDMSCQIVGTYFTTST